jgi:hypothetical protein
MAFFWRVKSRDVREVAEMITMIKTENAQF